MGKYVRVRMLYEAEFICIDVMLFFMFKYKSMLGALEVAIKANFRRVFGIYVLRYKSNELT